MELLYIRVIEHTLLKNKEFNFSNKYRIHYNDSNECYEVERLKSIDNFYGNNIINITAIVGDNGCGKSTLLRIILHALPYENCRCTDEGIVFAMLDDNTINYYSTMNEINRIKVKAEKVEKEEIAQYIYDDQGNYKCETFKNSRIIYTNNFLDYSDYFNKKYGQIEDLSFGGLMARDYTTSSEMRYIVKSNHYNEEYEVVEDIPNPTTVKFDRNYVIGNYYNCEILRQLKFKCIYDSQFTTSSLPFGFPTQINLKLNILYLSKSDDYSKIKRELADFNDSDHNGSRLLGLIDGLINHLERIDTITSQHDYILKIAKCALLNAINEVCLPRIVPYDKEHYYDILQTLPTSMQIEDSVESLSLFLSKWKEKLNRREFTESIFLTPYINFTNWLAKPHVELEIADISEYTAKINLDTEIKQNVFMDFVRLHMQTNSIYRYIDFYWPLSSGEFNLFSLYARFFSILRKERDSEKYFIYNNFPSEKIQVESLIVLIDEADLTFHPKWQQRYIKSLVDFLSQIYKSCKVQIIFTTHSPILLSDIDHSSVIRISKSTNESGHSELEVKNSEEKTFAQNIHTLFANSFVLDIKNLGETLGDFSYSKINYCLKLLNNSLNGKSVIHDNDLKYIEYIIDKIGEPVVYEMLSHKLMDYKKLIKKDTSSQKVAKALTTYKDFSIDEKREFIKLIIGEAEDM